MTKITFTNEFGEYSIAKFENLSSIEEVIEALVVPVLVAATYPEHLVRSMLHEDFRYE